MAPSTGSATATALGGRFGNCFFFGGLEREEASEQVAGGSVLLGIRGIGGVSEEEPGAGGWAQALGACLQGGRGEPFFVFRADMPTKYTRDGPDDNQ